MRKLIFSIITTVVLSTSSYATESVDFKTVWNTIKSSHPELKSSHEELSAAEAASARSDRHWLPQVYFSGKGFNTNDPAYSFMGNLGQRSITAADFSPASLNHPSNQNFAQFGLGMNLPIYEGGSSVALHEVQEFQLASKESANSEAQIDVYSSLVSSYANVLNSESALSSLEDLKVKVKSVLSRYSLGSKSNPVGYSGLLGLKSILNRIEALINQMEMKKSSSKNEIVQRSSAFQKEFDVKKQDSGQFLSEVLPSTSIIGAESSFGITTAESGVEMSKAMVSMERARFLPQLGLFSEGNMTTGSRSTGTSYVGGLYFKWSLFNPKDFGSVGEASHRHEAAVAKLENARVSEKIAREQLESSLVTIQENEKILNSSTQLMNEQVETAAKLFQSGSINALQLVEVFNRRADLIFQVQELNQNHIQIRTQLAKISRLKGISL